MGKSFEKQIKESLKDYQEQPPGNCWDSLSRQLDALHQVPTSSQVPLAEGTKVSAVRTVIGSTAAKFGISAAIIGGMIAAGTWLFPSNTEEQSILPSAAPCVAVADTLSEDSLHLFAATISHIQENNTPSNTTFSEGIPSYLLTESENVPCSSKKEQTVPATDSTRRYTPQTVAANRPERPATPEKGAEISHSTASTRESADEADSNNPLQQPELHIPNVITPNGDNINEYFVIENLEHTEQNRLVIYNRYNKVVYERKNYDNSWNAEHLPEGLYRYWLSFTYGGHEFMRQGSIKVIR